MTGTAYRKGFAHGVPFAAAALLVAAACAAPSLAQSMNYGSLEKLFKGPVTTSATGTPQMDTDVPADMTIVTAEDIRRSGARDIPGVLRHVPGVDVMQWGTDNYDVSIRGYDQAYASGTLVLIDGRQVYADYYGFIPWSTLPVELSDIRQIEVVKGPNAALFGFNATQGVINIITYNPRYDDTNAFTLRTGSPSLGEVSGVATMRLGDRGGFRISAGYRKNDDFSTPIPLAMQSSPRRDNDRSSVDAVLDYEIADGLEVALDASHSHAAVNEVSPNLLFQNSLYETNSILGRLTHETSTGVMQLVAYTNWIGWKGEPSIGFGQWQMSNQVTVVEGEDIFNLGAEHTLRVSFDYRHNTTGTTPYRGGMVSYDVLSGSGTWQWQVSPTIAWTNAVRVDSLSLNRSGSAPADYPYINADWDRTLNEVSFNSGLVWCATRDDTIRLIASRGVQLPSLVEAGALVMTNGPFEVTGTPDIKPTAVTNYEIAWDRTLPFANAKLHLTVFHQDMADIASVSGGFVFGPASLYSASTNIGNSHADGLELAASGKMAKAWHWSFGYRLESITDRFLPFAAGGSDFADFAHTTPKHLLKAALGWSDGRWHVDGFLNWQSNSSGLDFVYTGTQRVPVGSFANADARIAYRLADWATLSLSGQNLLQKSQRQTSGPAVGRQIYLTLTLKD